MRALALWLAVVWPHAALLPSAPPGSCVACSWSVALNRPGLDCATLNGVARAWDQAHNRGGEWGVWGLSSVGDPLVYSHLLRDVTYTQSPDTALTWLAADGPIIVSDTAPGYPHAIACWGLAAAGAVRCSDPGPPARALTLRRATFRHLPDFWAARPVVAKGR